MISLNMLEYIKRVIFVFQVHMPKHIENYDAYLHHITTGTLNILS
jgi:hypothetical protein